MPAAPNSVKNCRLFHPDLSSTSFLLTGLKFDNNKISSESKRDQSCFFIQEPYPQSGSKRCKLIPASHAITPNQIDSNISDALIDSLCKIGRNPVRGWKFHPFAIEC